MQPALSTHLRGLRSEALIRLLIAQQTDRKCEDDDTCSSAAKSGSSTSIGTMPISWACLRPPRMRKVKHPSTHLWAVEGEVDLSVAEVALRRGAHHSENGRPK